MCTACIDQPLNECSPETCTLYARQAANDLKWLSGRPEFGKTIERPRFAPAWERQAATSTVLVRRETSCVTGAVASPGVPRTHACEAKLLSVRAQSLSRACLRLCASQLRRNTLGSRDAIRLDLLSRAQSSSPNGTYALCLTEYRLAMRDKG
jgi:hypothetical protein